MALRPLPGGGVGFWLEYASVAPLDDPAWFWATDATQRAFFYEAARTAQREYGLSREAGLDRNGQPLVPIAEYTRDHRKSAMGWPDPDAPPLIPAHELSRTQSYLRWRYVPGKGVWFWWIFDRRVRGSWGKILQYHATGQVRGGAIRDVIGLTPGDVLITRTHMARWWAARRGRVRLTVIQPLEDTLRVPLPRVPKVLPPAARATGTAGRGRATFTVETAKVSAVGAGGRELGAGFQTRRYTSAGAVPSWLRKK
jgi:hypothetical protein